MQEKYHINKKGREIREPSISSSILHVLFCLYVYNNALIAYPTLAFSLFAAFVSISMVTGPSFFNSTSIMA